MITYADLVFMALNSENNAGPLYLFLNAQKARIDKENEIIKKCIKKHPSRTNSELLKPYQRYLDENFPVMSCEDAVIIGLNKRNQQ